MITYKSLMETTEKWLGTTNHNAKDTKVPKNWGDHEDDDFRRLDKSKFHPMGLQLHKKQKLTPHEESAIEDYVTSGHEDINYFHRNPPREHILDIDKQIQKNHDNDMEDKTKHLDSAISKHTTEHPIHVWRGIEPHVAKDLGLNKAHSGQVFHDKGYTSTTISPEVAKPFSSIGYHKTLMHIKIPKGSKAMHIASYGLDADNVEAPGQNEHEVLLPRGSKFKHIKTTEHDGTVIHHMEHIPGE